MVISQSIFIIFLINIFISAQSGNLIVLSYPQNQFIRIFKVENKPERVITVIDQGKTPYNYVDLQCGGYIIEWIDKSLQDYFSIELNKTTKVVFKEGRSFSLYANNSKNNYVCLHFGEKSGFSEGFEYYNVDSVLHNNKINFVRCNLHWDYKKKSFGSFTSSSVGKNRIIGPFNDEDAMLIAKRIENIAYENGWLHFFVTTEILNKK